MSKIVTMTEFLRNPKEVRRLVENGVKVFVKYQNKIVMEINLPDLAAKKIAMPTAKIGIQKELSREDIHSKNSWLDK
jgi:hypothetical protein